eukprot:6034088-Pleurochrysis_carterae.AAC.1
MSGPPAEMFAGARVPWDGRHNARSQGAPSTCRRTPFHAAVPLQHAAVAFIMLAPPSTCRHLRDAAAAFNMPPPP